MLQGFVICFVICVEKVSILSIVTTENMSLAVNTRSQRCEETVSENDYQSFFWHNCDENVKIADVGFPWSIDDETNTFTISANQQLLYPFAEVSPCKLLKPS